MAGRKEGKVGSTALPLSLYCEVCGSCSLCTNKISHMKINFEVLKNKIELMKLQILHQEDSLSKKS